MTNDRDLRERFAELRREDQAQAGEFSVFRLRARRHASPVRISAWIAVAAVLAVVVVIWAHRRERRDVSSPAISITDWKSSTAFLLRTPGQEVLRTIPRIGEWPASTETPGGSRKSPAIRKKSMTKTSPEEGLS
jgi:hypothetical protein